MKFGILELQSAWTIFLIKEAFLRNHPKAFQRLLRKGLRAASAFEKPLKGLSKQKTYRGEILSEPELTLLDGTLISLKADPLREFQGTQGRARKKAGRTRGP